MIKAFNRLFVVIVFVQSITVLRAQTFSPLDTVNKKSDTLKRTIPSTSTLTFSLDMRVRAEARNGYKTIPTPDTTSAFFINQRTRFNVDYRSKALDVFLSLQDARVWASRMEEQVNPVQEHQLR